MKKKTSNFKRTLLLRLRLLGSTHSQLIALLGQGDEPGHLVPQEDDLEFGEPGRDVLAALGPVVEGLETDAHVLVVGLALDLEGGDVVAYHRSRCLVVAFVVIVVVFFGGQRIRELLGQLVVSLIEGLGAGVGVEQVAVGGLELGVALVEAPAGVDQVVHAFELALGEVGAGDGEEVVEEEVVDLREGFDDGGGDGAAGGFGGEGHAGFEDLVCCRGTLVEDRLHEGHGVWCWGACEGQHVSATRE